MCRCSRSARRRRHRAVMDLASARDIELRRPSTTRRSSRAEEGSIPATTSSSIKAGHLSEAGQGRAGDRLHDAHRRRLRPAGGHRVQDDQGDGRRTSATWRRSSSRSPGLTAEGHGRRHRRAVPQGRGEVLQGSGRDVADVRRSVARMRRRLARVVRARGVPDDCPATAVVVDEAQATTPGSAALRGIVKPSPSRCRCTTCTSRHSGPPEAVIFRGTHLLFALTLRLPALSAEAAGAAALAPARSRAAGARLRLRAAHLRATTTTSSIASSTSTT